MKMGFGKYKNCQVDIVPLEYLKYISKQEWFQNTKARVRRAICERVGIPFIPNENPYASRFSGVSKGKAIMDKKLKKEIEFDDFNDLKKNIQ